MKVPVALCQGERGKRRVQKRERERERGRAVERERETGRVVVREGERGLLREREGCREWRRLSLSLSPSELMHPGLVR